MDGKCQDVSRLSLAKRHGVGERGRRSSLSQPDPVLASSEGPVRLI